ncbi:MAG: ROK family protein [Candidatus Buchananbacteria bacterium]
MKILSAVGMDIGGSHCTASVVDENGKLLVPAFRVRIDKTAPPGTIADVIADVIKTAIDNVVDPDLYKIVGIGGGAPGPLNMDTGVIGETPNLVTLRGFGLAEAISQRTGKPAFLNNDANLMIFGEAIAGAGQGCNSVYGCTIGNGFGHGWTRNGEIFVGQHFFGFEMAKCPVSLNGDDSTIERWVSIQGIVDKFRLCGGLVDKNTDPEAIAKLATQGDLAAQQTYGFLGRCLGFAFSWIQCALDPDIILVGGNIAKAWDLFQPSMTEFMTKHTWRDCPVPVMPMALGEQAGIIGGALLAISKFKAQV